MDNSTNNVEPNNMALNSIMLIYDKSKLINNCVLVTQDNINILYNYKGEEVIRFKDYDSTGNKKDTKYNNCVDILTYKLWKHEKTSDNISRWFVYSNNIDNGIYFYDTVENIKYYFSEYSKEYEDILKMSYDLITVEIIDNILMISSGYNIILLKAKQSVYKDALKVKFIDTIKLRFITTSIGIDNIEIEGVTYKEITYYKTCVGRGFSNTRYDSLFSTILDTVNGEIIHKYKERVKGIDSSISMVYNKVLHGSPQNIKIAINNNVLDSIGNIDFITGIRGCNNLVVISRNGLKGVIRINGDILLDIKYNSIEYTDVNTLHGIKKSINKEIIDGDIVNITDGIIIQNVIRYYRPLNKLPLAFIYNAEGVAKPVFFERYYEENLESITKYFNVYYNKKYTSLYVIYFGSSVNEYVLTDSSFNEISYKSLVELNEYGWEKLECTQKEY